MKKRLLASILTISMIASMLAVLVGAPIAHASTTEYVQANKTYQVGDTVYFGNYWQNDTNGDGKANQNDNKEPIEWSVLSQNGDDLFLMATKGLDAQPYNEMRKNVTWETCTLRTWLNDEFYNDAFSSSEQSAIKTTTLENEDNLSFGTEGGNNTNDKVFLLSYSDVINTSYGFSSSYSTYDTNRQIKATEYAVNRNAYVPTSGGYAGNCCWWLRSPGIDSDIATFVVDDGHAYDFGDAVDYTDDAVVPALHLNLKSIEDDFEYAVITDGCAEIIDYNGAAVNLEIPSEIDGYMVTSISDSAFNYCSTLKSVKIPSCITNIGVGEFSSAFGRCDNLEYIEVDEQNSSYESVEGVLYNEDLTELITYPSRKEGDYFDIPNTVKTIVCNAFYYCIFIKKIEIPNSVTNIGHSAFYGCSSLESLTIPNSVTKLGILTFGECTALKSIVLSENLEIINTNTFIGCITLERIKIPNGVMSIESGAFYNCCSLQVIELPGSVVRIEDNVFSYCSQLWHVIYSGTETEWNNIELGEENNENFISAKLHCVSGADAVIEKITTITCTEVEDVKLKCSICEDEKTIISYDEPLGHNIVNGVCERCYPKTDRTYQTGDIVTFGNYWQNDTNNDGIADQNDEKEPIEWRVLSQNGDDLFLMAKKGLDCQPYNEAFISVTWETCTLRTWLNDDFYTDAFSSSEQSAIKTTTLDNEDNPEYGTDGGNSTNDKVFLLSYSDVTNTNYGFSGDDDEHDINRQIKPTEYAVDKNVIMSLEEFAGNCCWWLRKSTSSSSIIAANASYNGEVYNEGTNVYYPYAVCPVVHINLNYIDTDAIKLEKTKESAKIELELYKNPDDYRDAEKAVLEQAIVDAKIAIDDATDVDEVNVAVVTAKSVMDAIKTDAEYDLEEAIATAKAEIDNYKNADDYREAQKTELADAIATAKAELDAAESIDEVNSLLADAKTSMDEIKTDEQLTAEEEANVTPTPTATVTPTPTKVTTPTPKVDVTRTPEQTVAPKPTSTPTVIPTSTPNAETTKTPTAGDYQYNIKNDGTIEITKYTGNESVIQIPNEIDGYAVTSIGDRAFANNKTLINVFLPENLQKVGQHAFDSCLSLANVGLNTNVKIISERAFYNCPALKMVTLPESIAEIGKYAFGYDNTNKGIFGFFIIGYSGTAAEKYANENGFTFTSVGESSGEITKKVTIKFTKKSVKIKRGKKATLKVKLTGAKKANFSVDKKGKKVVKLSKKKAKSVVVKGKKKGKATITAKAAGKKAKCKVTVK